MKNIKLKIIITITLILLIFIVYLTCDYNNILSKKGIDVSRLNFDLLGIFVNSIIVIGLYLMTYFLIDKKNIQTRNNQEEIIRYMLKNDYNACLNYLKLMSDNLTIERISKHIKGDVLLYKDDFFMNYINIPFENYQNITNYAIQGIVSRELLEKYYFIKRSYKEVVTGIISFSNMGKDVTNALNEGKENLISEIKKELEKITM